ncbi:MAG TPA: DnaB-like helicase C-terminal domain-containing protein [Terracidiphilus sp.]|nr:DnaB-like helicase C-terminal domain-containing protein [Terracidiphilus sp.]
MDKRTIREGEKMTGFPVSLDIERHILGACLRRAPSMDFTRGAVDLDDFSLDRHKRIWKVACALYDAGKQLDVVTLLAELEAQGEREAVGGFAYVVELGEGVPEGAPLSGWVDRLRECGLRRRMMAAAHLLEVRAADQTESVDDVLSGFATVAVDLAKGTNDNRRPISTADMIATEGISSLLGPRQHGAVSLPWPRLDADLGGFSAGQMIVVLAATSRGKTSFALQVAIRAALKGQTPVVWTMEMPPKQLFRRMVNQISGSYCGKSLLSLVELQGQREAIGQLDNYPVFFDQHSNSIGAFLSSLRQVRSRKTLGLAIVDYLQLIRSTDKENRAQEVSENSRAIKLAAMDFGIPILVLSQVDRGSVKGDGKIGLYSGKESGSIEQDADILLWIDAPELSRDQRTTISIHVGKNRDGPAGFGVPMVFTPENQTFTEIEDER